jgi:transcriptional regulator with PAS, ATPase and Fis domain
MAFLIASLLESELFGYEGGAFTGARKSGKAGKFELAHRGTIFLDEIGDLPLHLQVKLLHVLQRRQIERVGGSQVLSVDVRVIAATNRDLMQMMHDGEFREDLYFRLCVIPLLIPSLRERKEDIEMLLYYYLDKFNILLEKSVKGFDQDALDVLIRYNWPGIIRELENAMEYSVSFEKGPLISCSSIQPRIMQTFNVIEHPASLKDALDTFQRDLIDRCLRETGRSLAGKREAAIRLGISESTLYRRIRELNIADDPH